MKNKSIQLVIIISLTISLAYFLSSWSQQLFFLISFGIELLGVFIGLRLLLVDQRSTNSKVAWIAIIFVIPVFGVISYLFFGRNPQNRIFSTNQNVERAKLIERIHQVSCESEPNETPKLSQRIEALTGIHAMRGNRLTLLTDGQETFSAILEALQGAKDHIHIQYYIFKQ
ncbi:MAG: PLDc N-terminal domain-containing protein, partial [Carnobacterium sp.]